MVVESLFVPPVGAVAGVDGGESVFESGESLEIVGTGEDDAGETGGNESVGGNGDGVIRLVVGVKMVNEEEEVLLLVLVTSYMVCAGGVFLVLTSSIVIGAGGGVVEDVVKIVVV